MIKFFLFGILVLITTAALAVENYTIVLDRAPVNINDINSIKRGAKFFAATCMACHTMVYMRYNKLAKDAGVIYEKMPIQWPQGIKPPDLSLEASLRGPHWIYTYLHSFYTDPSRPTGVNNLLVPNTTMAAILVPLQGKQILTPLANLKESRTIYLRQYNWYDLVELESQGSMSPQQFDAMIADVVNFLVYAAEPHQREQHRIGYWTLCFLFGFFILAYLLKRAYWKDVD